MRLRPPPTDPTGEESEPASQRDGEGDRKRRGRGGRRVRGGRGETGRGRGREAGERGRGRLGGESGTGRQGEQGGRGRGEGGRERDGVGTGVGGDSATLAPLPSLRVASAQQGPSKGKCLRRVRPAPASGPPAPAPCAPAGLATPPAASAPFAARNRRGQRRGTGKGVGGLSILAGSAAGPAGPTGWRGPRRWQGGRGRGGHPSEQPLLAPSKTDNNMPQTGNTAAVSTRVCFSSSVSSFITHQATRPPSLVSLKQATRPPSLVG